MVKILMEIFSIQSSGGWDWAAVGALSGVIAVAFVIGGATTRFVRDKMGHNKKEAQRLDLLEIRLFGLPADAETGAKKMDGEFDRIDKRLDDMKNQILTAIQRSA